MTTLRVQPDVLLAQARAYGGVVRTVETAASEPLENLTSPMRLTQPVPVRFVRGERMRTSRDALAELSAALQLPHFAGDNWDSFDDCISDLSWLGARGLVLIVTGAREVLTKKPADLRHFVSGLERGRASWRHPNPPADPSHEPGPFTVVLQDTAAALAGLSSDWIVEQADS